MSSVAGAPEVLRRAPVPTWFGVGGGADRLVHAQDAEQLRAALELDPVVRVLGDGANLLVDDDGVDGVVVVLGGELAGVEFGEPGSSGAVRVRAGAGARLPGLINACVRRGLAGLEGLAGVPASLGGAAVMNAGGAHGQIGDVVERVHVLTRDGRARVVEREDARFGYRGSALGGMIVTGVDLLLTAGDPAALRERQLAVMAEKKRQQPLAARSCGCVFKNPTLTGREAPGLGEVLRAAGLTGDRAGRRVSAGLLIDRCGGKGARVGGARVSDRHANFFEVSDGCTARDVLALIEQVRARVRDAWGVELETEVVVWRRGR